MPRSTSHLSLVAAALVTATVIAACGSSGSTSSSSSSSGARPTQAQVEQDAVNFADCMRSHGVPTFPDPTSPHEFKFELSPGAGGNSQSPAFQSAQTACAHLMPGGGPSGETPAQRHARVIAALAFARCLRRHGFPSFPDPTSTGQLTHEMLASAGINIHQPAAQQAADACVGVTNGLITRAVVARFIAGQ